MCVCLCTCDLCMCMCVHVVYVCAWLCMCVCVHAHIHVGGSRNLTLGSFLRHSTLSFLWAMCSESSAHQCIKLAEHWARGTWLILGHFSFLFYCCLRTLTKNNLEKPALVSSDRLLSIMKGRQGRNSGRNQRQELKQRPCENTAYWLAQTFSLHSKPPVHGWHCPQ